STLFPYTTLFRSRARAENREIHDASDAGLLRRGSDRVGSGLVCLRVARARALLQDADEMHDGLAALCRPRQRIDVAVVDDRAIASGSKSTHGGSGLRRAHGCLHRRSSRGALLGYASQQSLTQVAIRSRDQDSLQVARPFPGIATPDRERRLGL